MCSQKGFINGEKKWINFHYIKIIIFISLDFLWSVYTSHYTKQKLICEIECNNIISITQSLIECKPKNHDMIIIMQLQI